MQVGERYLTTHEIQRELVVTLRPQLLRRKRMVEAGTWTEADQAKLVAQSDALGVQLAALLREKAVMEEYARSQGHGPDELRLEERLRRRTREAGGIKALLRKEGRTLGEIRDELRGEDMRVRFMRSLVPDAGPPGPSDIREYYAAHRDEIRAPAKVKTRILLIAKGDDPAGALAKAEDLKRELQFAADRFEERARELSQHRETAGRGGLITAEVDGEETEWIGIDLLLRQNAVIGRAVARLSPGRVSDVLAFANGYALVKVEGLREGGPLRIEEAAEPIKEKLALEERESLRREWVVFYQRSMYLADGRGRRVSPRVVRGR
jgi:parvulin-like peptidyl-prolyl isomerase